MELRDVHLSQLLMASEFARLDLTPETSIPKHSKLIFDQKSTIFFFFLNNTFNKNNLKISIIKKKIDKVV
jgi:hypothetical protein